MSHHLLHGAKIHAGPQELGEIGCTEAMQEPTLTLLAGNAAVAACAVEPGAARTTLHEKKQLGIGLAILPKTSLELGCL